MFSVRKHKIAIYLLTIELNTTSDCRAGVPIVDSCCRDVDIAAGWEGLAAV